jgi:hypothetical protein
MEVAEERRTLEDVAGQVTLVLAAAGSGRRAVWVGVLPLLEEFFGLVEQDLAREKESQWTVFQKGWSCRSGSVRAVQCRETCGVRGRRAVVRRRKLVMDGCHSLSVVWARGCWRWLRRESGCTRPGRARGNGGRTSQGPA